MKRLLAALTVLVGCTQAIYHGVDFSTAISETTFKCFLENGMHFAISRAWRSNGSIDPNAVTNIKNARAAGFPNVDVYMFPCRAKSAAEQIN